jgi:hypothetical protein
MKYWTASEIISANTCTMQWWLRYRKKPREKEDYLSSFAFGHVYHDLVEKFWKRKEDKYSTPEEFAEYARGKWLAKSMGSDNSKRPIKWRYQGEKYVLAQKIKKHAPAVFNFFMTEGPPIYVELPFKFVLDGIGYKGRIDEIRIKDGKPIVRDYKSGYPRMKSMRLNFDPQPTFYCLNFCNLVHNNPELAIRFDMNDISSGLMGNPYYLTDRVGFEFVMLEDHDEDGSPIVTAHETTRTDVHYKMLVNMIRGLEKKLESDGVIYPEYGGKCDYCALNTGCVEYSSQAPLIEAEDTQMTFPFSEDPLYRDHEIRKKGVVDGSPNPELHQVRLSSDVRGKDPQRRLAYEFRLAKERRKKAAEKDSREDKGLF